MIYNHLLNMQQLNQFTTYLPEGQEKFAYLENHEKTYFELIKSHRISQKLPIFFIGKVRIDKYFRISEKPMFFKFVHCVFTAFLTLVIFV